MKIDPNKISGLGTAQEAQQNRQTNKADKAADAFGGLLAEALSNRAPGGAPVAAAPGPAGGLSPLLNPALMNIQPAPGVAGTAAVSEATGVTEPGGVGQDVENLLSAWDDYAAQLGKGGDLKGLWSKLEAITGSLTQLKTKAGEDPAASPLIQELEILATTERFKFNRGDYL